MNQILLAKTNLLRVEFYKAEADYYKKKGIVDPTNKERLMMDAAVSRRKKLKAMADECRRMQLEIMWKKHPTDKCPECGDVGKVFCKCFRDVRMSVEPAASSRQHAADNNEEER